MDIDKDFGENVVLDKEENEPVDEEEREEEDTSKPLEDAGIIRNGEVIEAPPTLTPAQQQQKYKRKMTEKRLEALKKAREAKKLKREKMKQEKEQAQPKAQPQSKPQPRRAKPQAQQVKNTETEEERINRLVEAKLARMNKTSAPAKAPAPKETEEQRIERLVQERLKSVKPREPDIDPAVKKKQDLVDYYTKLIYG